MGNGQVHTQRSENINNFNRNTNLNHKNNQPRLPYSGTGQRNSRIFNNRNKNYDFDNQQLSDDQSIDDKWLVSVRSP